MARLVGPGGHVLALEIEPDLAANAARNLAHRPWVTVKCRSGLLPDLQATDVIYVNAGLPRLPELWLRALQPKGRLLFPFQPTNGFGGMLRIERPTIGRVWQARFVTRAAFIGCVGGQEDGASRRLAEAFRAGKWDDVRSLRFHSDKAPDASCWFEDEGWWLSTSAAGQPIILPDT